jgi:hypothetical protein
MAVQEILRLHHPPKEITAGVTHHQAPITPLVVEVVHLLLVATIQETHLALVALVLPRLLQVHP